MRFQVTMTPPVISMPPVIQDGFETSLFGAPKIDAHELLQDQADAPGREQGLERPAIEEADDGALEHDADARRRRGSRSAPRRRDRQSNQRGGRKARKTSCTT